MPDISPDSHSCAKLFARKSPGFSLVELLVVMAIVVALGALIAPAITNFGKANLLRTSGDRVSGLLKAARQNAMARNAMTALVVITDPAVDLRYRGFALLELKGSSSVASTSDWKQISKWDILPEGVVVDPSWPSDQVLAFAQSSAQIQLLPATLALPTQLNYGPQKISSYKFLVFLPSGCLLIDNSANLAQIQLAEGFFRQGSDTPVYTRPSSGGGPANYYRISILGATSRLKIERP
jgi:prepilin-type N-terminal cleavage/methylation domain-containing protein